MLGRRGGAWGCKGWGPTNFPFLVTHSLTSFPFSERKCHWHHPTGFSVRPNKNSWPPHRQDGGAHRLGANLSGVDSLNDVYLPPPSSPDLPLCSFSAEITCHPQILEPSWICSCYCLYSDLLPLHAHSCLSSLGLCPHPHLGGNWPKSPSPLPCKQQRHFIMENSKHTQKYTPKIHIPQSASTLTNSWSLLFCWYPPTPAPLGDLEQIQNIKWFSPVCFINGLLKLVCRKSGSKRGPYFTWGLGLLNLFQCIGLSSLSYFFSHLSVE